MPERDRKIPDWARKEREQDLEWIGEYFEVFWFTSNLAYREVGRGAIVVDTTIQMPGAGHPFGYGPQEGIEEQDDEDAKRMVKEYDPQKEIVVVLWKDEERTSTYRVGIQQPGSQGRGGKKA